MNRTFSIIKPDSTKRNITGAINKIIEDNNLNVQIISINPVGLKNLFAEINL